MFACFKNVYRLKNQTIVFRVLVWVCAWLIQGVAFAQVKPGTGQLLNNLPPAANKYPEPLRKKSSPASQDLPLPSGLDQPSEPDTEEKQIPFAVNGLVFEGNTVFTSEELAAVVDLPAGEWLTLPQLQTHLGRITEHYRKAGYPLASAHIPAQVLQDGLVVVHVSEPRWAHLVLSNQSHMADHVILRTAKQIRPGSLVQDKDMESAAVHLSALPGTDITSELRAGDSLDTTDMVINASPSNAVSSMLTIDNFGSRYTGRDRATAYIAFSNPFRSGDVFSVNMLSSGELLNYQQLGYEIPVLSPGVSVGLTATHMQYRLGNGAESLMAHGHLKQTSHWFQYPWIATAVTRLDTRMQYEVSEMSDHQDSTDSKNDRHLHRFSASVNLDTSDTWWGHAGSTQLNAGVSFGRLFFDDPVSLANDAATAKTAGEFAKWQVRASRSQSLDPVWSLVWSLDMQSANRNLDATQKFAIGGFHSVRAYESGVLSADEAVFTSVECRLHLPTPPQGINISGEWYGAVFWDAAMARINKRPWSTDSNQATLLASGIGLYWQGNDHWRASLALANVQGRVPDVLASSGVTLNSVWFELSKGWR